MSIREKAWAAYYGKPEYVAMSKRAFWEAIDAYESVKVGGGTIRLPHSEVADLICDMVGAYNERAAKLKGFHNFQFKAMEAALLAIEKMGYSIIKPTVSM